MLGNVKTHKGRVLSVYEIILFEKTDRLIHLANILKDEINEIKNAKDTKAEMIILAEGNLNAVSTSTLWWMFGIGALWLCLVYSDIKSRIQRLEKENRQYREVYHV